MRNAQGVIGVVLGTVGVVLYDNPVGAPPLVVISVKMGPLREAFSFLAALSPVVIVLRSGLFVNPPHASQAAAPFLHSNHPDRSSRSATGSPSKVSVFSALLSTECGL